MLADSAPSAQSEKAERHQRTRNIWKIAPGFHGNDWETFLENGCIGIGWLGFKSWDGMFASQDDVLDALKQVYPDEPYGNRGGAAGTIWNFIANVKPGDLVIANEGRNAVAAVGIVTSEYIPPNSRRNPIRSYRGSHRRHVHLVDWVITESVEIELPPSRRFFFAINTLQSMNKKQVQIIKQSYVNGYPNNKELLRRAEAVLGDLPVPMTPTSIDIAEPPPRIETTTYRILRDTVLAQQVKSMHNFECQICGATIELPNGERYAEAHHIKPLGRDHNGPDVAGNIVCLCPNHHVECDYGIRKLTASSLSNNANHKVDQTFVRYHNETIYRNA